jgi:hypothetical protein
MPIKYAEITILFDTKNEGLFTNLKRNWLGYETICEENSDIIISFDDGTLSCVKDEFKDCNFKFFVGISNLLPMHFKRDKRENEKYINVYFARKPEKKADDNLHLNFNKIFSSEIRKKSKTVGSCFNCIYYCNVGSEKKEIFSILKLYSNEDKPRFLLAYDSDEFNRDEVIYIVNCIFKNKYNTDIL